MKKLKQNPGKGKMSIKAGGSKPEGTPARHQSTGLCKRPEPSATTLHLHPLYIPLRFRPGRISRVLASPPSHPDPSHRIASHDACRRAHALTFNHNIRVCLHSTARHSVARHGMMQPRPSGSPCRRGASWPHGTPCWQPATCSSAGPDAMRIK